MDTQFEPSVPVLNPLLLLTLTLMQVQMQMQMQATDLHSAFRVPRDKIAIVYNALSRGWV